MFNSDRLLAAFLLTAVLLQTSCASTTGPQVSDREIQEREREISIKAQAFKAKQTERVRAIAKRLIENMNAEDQAKLRNLRYEVNEDQTLNASVRPGVLMVNYGMIRFVESDDELAVVIAHELAHLIKGHYGKKMTTTILAATVGIATGVAIDSMGGSGVGGMVGEGVAKGIAGTFSRDYEREADYFGFQNVYMSGFDLKTGAAIWERFAIEAPKTMTVGLFSSHPSSPERLIRAEKTLAALAEQGIVPNLFNRPGASGPGPMGSGVLNKTVSIPAQILTVPVKTIGAAVTPPMGLVGSDEEGKPFQASSAGGEPTDEEKEIMALRAQIEQLKEVVQEQENLTDEERQARAEAQVELEQALLEAKEASLELRYAEFGVKEMGLAKKVSNYWVGTRVSGEQQMFPFETGQLDWYVAYDPLSKNVFKSAFGKERKYRAYWYSPNGRLFSQQDFVESKVRSDLARTTLHWDKELGDYLVGQWFMRVFENGQLLDERKFEIVRT